MNRGTDPFSDDDLRLLERFTEVFALGYRRYLDLSAAEERARQLARDAAAQRVRVEATSMRTTDDINKVVAVLFEQLVELGVQTPGASIIFFDEESDTARAYTALSNPRQLGLSWSRPTVVEVSDSTIVRSVITESGTLSRLAASIERSGPEARLKGPELGYGSWQRGEVSTYDRESTAESVAEMFEFMGLEGNSHAYNEAWLGHWRVTNVPFKYGQVGYREREFSQDSVDIVRMLTDALAVGYLRYLDFQQLEQQNRELEVERALEQLRTRIAAMESSGDIAGVVDALEETLKEQGVPAHNVGIRIVDEAATSATFFTPSFGERTTTLVGVDDFEQWIPRWREGGTFQRPWSVEDLQRVRRNLVSDGTFNSLDEVESVWGPLGERYVIDVFFPQGSVAVIRTGSDAFSDDHVRLLERFAEVFALGYRRYLDLEAEQRASQLALEGAADRVRAEAMAMASSDDLPGLCGALFREIQALGIESPLFGIYFVDEEAEQLKAYAAYNTSSIHSATVRTAVAGSTSATVTETEKAGVGLIETVHGYSTGEWPAVMTAWRNGETHQSEQTWTESHSNIKGLIEYGVDPEFSLSLLGAWQVFNVPFEHGFVAFRERESSEDHIAMVKQVADALAVGYLRYLDFQQLEAQNRELEVERALERVRTDVAAMEKTADLAGLSQSVESALRELGVPIHQLAINTLEDDDRHLVGHYPGIPRDSFTMDSQSGEEPFAGWRRGWGEAGDLPTALRQKSLRRCAWPNA